MDSLEDLKASLAKIDWERAAYVKENLRDISECFGLITTANDKLSQGLERLRRLEGREIGSLQESLAPDQFEATSYSLYRNAMQGYKDGIRRAHQNRQRAINAKILKLLRTNVSLPVCLRLVGHLKDQDESAGMSQDSLLALFLQARDQYLHDFILKNDPMALMHESPEEAFGRAILIMREPLLDVIVQYTAIFEEAMPLSVLVSRRFAWFTRLLAEILDRTLIVSHLAFYWNQLVILDKSFHIYNCEFMAMIAPMLIQRAVIIAVGKLDKAISLFVTSASRIPVVEGTKLKSIPAFVILSNALADLMADVGSFGVPQLRLPLRKGILIKLGPIEKFLQSERWAVLRDVYQTEFMGLLEESLSAIFS